LAKVRGFPKGSVCKPCWELRYCPYGVLVEDFPIAGSSMDLDEIRRLYSEALANLTAGNLNSEDQIWDEIHHLMYLRPDNWEYLAQYDPEDISCKIWGHVCPVFLSQSGATETKVPRRQGRYLPREIMLKVVRRDNHICQLCYQYVPDNEIEFDHIIPNSKGGPISVENIRLLCRECNRKKSNALDELLE
jgi:5-methylcytosine-specific restriction endonuclease McrA